MANVLPLKVQRAVWSEYRARAVLVLSFALLASALVALLSLAPSYVVLKGSSATKDAAASPPLQGQADIQGVLRTQALVTAVLPILSSTTSPERAIREALALRPTGVHVERVSYRAGDGRVVLSGSGDTREAIDAYRAAIADDGRFGNVSVPLGALVGIEGGRFTITIAGLPL